MLAVRTKGLTLRNLRKTASVILAVGVVAAASLTGTQAASAQSTEVIATSASVAQTETITPEQFQTALQGLEASDTPRTAIRAGEATLYEYHFPEGDLTFPSEATFLASAATGETIADPGVVSPMIEVVTKGQYMAVGLNRADQALLVGGGGAALGLALCAIPGVCPVSTILIAGAVAYLTERGLCPEGQQLWWYDVKGGSTFACRSSAPALP